MKYPRLTAEDEQAFLRALDNIWSAVGMDCLRGEAAGRNIKDQRTEYGYLYAWERVTVSRATVICITTDMFAGAMPRETFNMPKEQYDRIRKWMMSTPGHIVDKIARKQFPERRFGA